jgi:hypothetical protein
MPVECLGEAYRSCTADLPGDLLNFSIGFVQLGVP